MSTSGRPMEEIYGVRGTASAPRKKSPLEEQIERQQELTVAEIQSKQARAISLDMDKAIARSEKELNDLRGDAHESKGGGLGPDAQVLSELLKQGMDLQKASEMVAKMDPLTRARIAMVYSQRGGADQMYAWQMLANQPGTTADQAVTIATKLLDQIEKRTAQPNQPQPMTIQDVMNLYDRMKPGEEVDRAMGGLYEKVEKLESRLEAEREARHQDALRHEQEMSLLRQQTLESKLNDISRKLEEGAGGSKDTLSTFTKSVEELKKIGLPIAIGAEAAAKSPLEESKALVETVMNSPGMGKVFDGVADRLRTRGGGFRPPQQAPPAGSQFFCDVCLNQGIRTPLPVTPEVLAGTATVTCPRCQTTFSKGPQRPPTSQQGPPPGPGAPGSRPWNGID